MICYYKGIIIYFIKNHMEQIQLLFQNSIKLHHQQNIKINGVVQQDGNIFGGGYEDMKKEFEQDFKKYIEDLSMDKQKIQSKDQSSYEWIPIQNRQQSILGTKEDLTRQILPTQKIRDFIADQKQQNLKKQLEDQYDAYLQSLRQVICIIQSKENSYMGRYRIYRPQKEERDGLYLSISRGQHTFVNNSVDSQYQKLVKLHKQKKNEQPKGLNIIQNWFGCFAKIIEFLEKKYIFNRDLRVRNTISLKQYFLAIDFEDLILLDPQNGKETQRLLKCWLQRSQQKYDYKYIKKFRQFIDRFIQLQPQEKKIQNFGQKICNPIVSTQIEYCRIIIQNLFKQFDEKTQQIKKIRQEYKNAKGIQKDDKNIRLLSDSLRKIMKIRHILQFLVAVHNITEQCCSKDGTIIDEDIKIITEDIIKKNYEVFLDLTISNLVGQKQQTNKQPVGQFYSKFLEKLEGKFTNQKYVKITVEQNLDFNIILVQYIKMLKLFSFSKIGQISPNSHSYTCRDDSYQITCCWQVFKDNKFYFLRYFLTDAYQSLKELASYGIYMPSINYKNFVREGSAFKIRYVSQKWQVPFTYVNHAFKLEKINYKIKTKEKDQLDIYLTNKSNSFLRQIIINQQDWQVNILNEIFACIDNKELKLKLIDIIKSLQGDNLYLNILGIFKKLIKINVLWMMKQLINDILRQTQERKIQKKDKSIINQQLSPLLQQYNTFFQLQYFIKEQTNQQQINNWEKKINHIKQIINNISLKLQQQSVSQMQKH